MLVLIPINRLNDKIQKEKRMFAAPACWSERPADWRSFFTSGSRFPGFTMVKGFYKGSRRCPHCMLVLNKEILKASESVRHLASTSWRESKQSKGVVGKETREAELVFPLSRTLSHGQRKCDSQNTNPKHTPTSLLHSPNPYFTCSSRAWRVE